jgi:flavodoxin
MDWAEFFKILADFLMKLVAFFKNSDNSSETAI